MGAVAAACVGLGLAVQVAAGPPVIAVAEARGERADQLGAGLARRCRDVLVERIDFAQTLHGVYGPAALHYTGWQERSPRLCETAGEAAEALRQN